MAISFSRPDPSSPAAVSAASFNVSRRGFDQTEVRDFLRMVSAEMARLQERERFLESELKAMQTRGMSAPGMLDEEVVTALLGEEAARVLGTAREASSQIRLRAEEAATRLVKEASSDATRLREEAELEAVRRREDAAADAEAEIELAKQQGRDMVNEAREYREKVLTELARRRELAREQIEQLIHNRDRLLNAFERARLATDDVMTGLVSVDHDLPREYINLAPTTGPVPTIVLERVVEAFAEAEAEAEEPEVIELFDHTKLEEIEPEATQAVVEE
ncbi:MAG: DivIVA domain-containing protein, partial [Actinobacteria bacterium]|nr:DivIVA domain-containing protein [Actinomycetota bacterium]